MEFRKIVEEYGVPSENNSLQVMQVRMSDNLVNEKMIQIQDWKDQIDEGELYLDTEEYEDYSDGYWESDWITEYYDNQEIGDKIQYMIQFAEDCVDDRCYQQANEIYEWLWEMSVFTEDEYGDPVDLEINASVHPSLYLSVMEQYEKAERMEVSKSFEGVCPD